jgi:glycosyltransferase involved in cell wall biosynthesis
MKVVYVTESDLAGRRFNGHDLQRMLNKEDGYEAKQFVVSKAGNSNDTLKLIKTKTGHFVREKCKEFEERISMQSVIYPFGELLAEHDDFLGADIVHYHLIFNHFMSIYSFKKLVQMKPSVWTFHDPWAMTGHCVYPVDCEGWLTGCKNCPYLDRYSPLKEDNASSIWNIKRDIYKELDIDIVVASEWMYDMVKRSPLTKHFERVHLIPFGIDLDLFKRRENRDEIRMRLGIDKDDFVIMFRQSSQEFKGLIYIKEMFEKLNSKLSVVLLTVGETGLLEEYKDKYKIIEYEWVSDDNFMVDLYSCADLFLMPSIAEAFGLMAVEAMACSLPVIVFEGTALPSVTFSPDCGIALNKEEAEEFVITVKRLMSSPRECIKRGQKGRKISRKYYNIEEYNQKIKLLYKKLIHD